MQANEQVFIWSKEYIYSEVYGLSSFKGFLYEPSHEIKVAWSVHVRNDAYIEGKSWRVLDADPDSNLAYNFIEVCEPAGLWQLHSAQVKLTTIFFASIRPILYMAAIFPSLLCSRSSMK